MAPDRLRNMTSSTSRAQYMCCGMGKKRKGKGKQKHQPAAPAVKTTAESGVSSTTRAPPAPSVTATPLSAEVEWPRDKADQDRLLTLLKYQTLGPFLFSQKTLSLEAELCAVEGNLLPKHERVWPVFFEVSQWRNAVLVVQVMLTSFNLIETNQSFRDYLFKGQSAILKESMVARVLKMHSKMMTDYSTTEVEVVHKVLRLQVLALGEVGVSSPAYRFLDGLQEKEQLVLPIKERGNANFKENKYRAAIGDYTRAIRISPYSAVLYCNRALCYLRCGDTWNACVDSYRALVLKPDWEKPYYRCSEGWMLLGNHTTALQVNGMGCELCTSTSDLLRQKGEIMVAMASGSSKTPPTGPAPSSEGVSGATGGGEEREEGDGHERERRKADKKEFKQKPEIVRGEMSDFTRPETFKTGDNADLATVATEGTESDLEDITDYKPEGNAETTVEGEWVSHSETTVEGDVPQERAPIEDETEWEFRHTATSLENKPYHGAESVRLRELHSMFNMEQRPVERNPDWMADKDDDIVSDDDDWAYEEKPPEPSEAQIAQREAQEMAAYRQRERERDKLRAERQAMRNAEQRKMAHTLPNPDPFTRFETLQAPTLDNGISTKQLFSMLKQVPSRQMIPQQYSAHSEAWCSLESLPSLNPLIRPKPPATTFSGTFDEVWCPMLADVMETADIIPPRIHYVGNMVTKYIAHHPPHYHRYEL